MCFSATASFTAAAVLLPAGALSAHRAYRVDRRYIAICALPLFFGMQQFFEGMVWIAGAHPSHDLVEEFSLGYMFFSWLVWPVWVPVALYFLEPNRRKPIYLAFAIVGGMLGAVLYVPYFAHAGWLVTRFLENAIQYDGTDLLDLLMPQEAKNLLYVMIVTTPLFIVRDRDVNIFGILVVAVMAVTYFFFSFAYISVFCFGGAVMSIYLAYMIFKKEIPRHEGVLTYH